MWVDNNNGLCYAKRSLMWRSVLEQQGARSNKFLVRLLILYFIVLVQYPWIFSSFYPETVSARASHIGEILGWIAANIKWENLEFEIQDMDLFMRHSPIILMSQQEPRKSWDSTNPGQAMCSLSTPGKELPTLFREHKSWVPVLICPWLINWRDGPQHMLLESGISS